MTAENTKIFCKKVLDLQRIVKCPIHGNIHILAANVAPLEELRGIQCSYKGKFCHLFSMDKGEGILLWGQKLCVLLTEYCQTQFFVQTSLAFPRSL